MKSISQLMKVKSRGENEQLMTDVLTKPGYSFAREHGVVIANDSRLVCKRGFSRVALLESQRVAGRALTVEIVDDEVFARSLDMSYGGGETDAVSLAADLSESAELSAVAEAISHHGDLLDGDDDAPVIRLINAMLAEAIRRRASDVHIETYETRLIVRLRIDGVLTSVLDLPRGLAALLVSRVKVMARLDIAEKRVPQDGRITVRLAGNAVDVRVSTIPASHGERVVMRLLEKQSGTLELPALGMRESTEKAFKRLLSNPHGIILVTGPTGSGKSTTLYAGLNYLNDASCNILTVEDPIEYHIEGVGQTQVNNKAGMTFARGLRALLRQDPDVVMIGEIRDGETAEIAVQASLTGHLVLSTLHTNSALGAVTRLADMGVEPYLLASSIIGVVAQRLVRRLCLECRQTVAVDEDSRRLFEAMELDYSAGMFAAVGCSACAHTGYSGRMAIFDVIEIDETLRHLIHQNAAEPELEQVAGRVAGEGMRRDGFLRVISGETTLEEVFRVTRKARAEQ